VQHVQQGLRVGEELAPAHGRQQCLALAAQQAQASQPGVRRGEHGQIALAVRRPEQLVAPPVRPALRRLANDRAHERMGLRKPDPLDAALEKPSHKGRRLVTVGALRGHGADKDRGSQPRRSLPSRSLREVERRLLAAVDDRTLRVRARRSG
jgi:hypothetical protein